MAVGDSCGWVAPPPPPSLEKPKQQCISAAGNIIDPIGKGIPAKAAVATASPSPPPPLAVAAAPPPPPASRTPWLRSRLHKGDERVK